jgi:hypothetical protein
MVFFAEEGNAYNVFFCQTADVRQAEHGKAHVIAACETHRGVRESRERMCADLFRRFEGRHLRDRPPAVITANGCPLNFFYPMLRVKPRFAWLVHAACHFRPVVSQSKMLGLCAIGSANGTQKSTSRCCDL